MLTKGTKVRTIDELHPRDYTESAHALRMPCASGTVVGSSDSHGLCYYVLHDKDSTIGSYDPNELTVRNAIQSGIPELDLEGFHIRGITIIQGDASRYQLMRWVAENVSRGYGMDWTNIRVYGGKTLRTSMARQIRQHDVPDGWKACWRAGHAFVSKQGAAPDMVVIDVTGAMFRLSPEASQDALDKLEEAREGLDLPLVLLAPDFLDEPPPSLLKWFRKHACVEYNTTFRKEPTGARGGRWFLQVVQRGYSGGNEKVWKDLSDVRVPFDMSDPSAFWTRVAREYPLPLVKTA